MDDFELVYARYFTPVYSFAYQLTGSAHEAEELTAETFFKALKAIGRYDGGGDIRVWLCQIAKHTWYNQWRRKKRELPLEDDTLPGGGAPLAQALEDGETAGRLHAALHRMAEPYKEVFTLRVFCEQPYARIAELFGKTESWARVIYHRAKAKLLQDLEETSLGK